MNTLFLGFALLGAWQEPEAQLPSDTSAVQVGSAAKSDYLVRAKDGSTLLLLPRDEKLTYRVDVDIAFLEAALGKVTQVSRIEPYEPSVLLQGTGPSSASSARESAHLSIHAKGDYALYSLDSTLETLHLPQTWPSIVHRSSSDGTTKKRREIMIGMRGGAPASSYRRDSKKGARKGTRIWREADERNVPADTLDMLSAVFAFRTLIRSDQEELVLPLLDKDCLWQLTLKRGDERRIKTAAGTFDAVEMVFVPAPWPEEDIEEDSQESFEGLFGMRGSIHVWVEKKTGVTVRIQGELPAGPFTLGVDVVLDAYEGTPADFAPIGAVSNASASTGADGRAGK